ncbi:MAG: hypothetical protein JSS32_08985 [Verrucomicrobia bacterium]|nr:hypothetical protein [Verrucomicrobiota bacterium]
MSLASIADVHAPTELELVEKMYGLFTKSNTDPSESKREFAPKSAEATGPTLDSPTFAARPELAEIAMERFDAISPALTETMHKKWDLLRLEQDLKTQLRVGNRDKTLSNEQQEELKERLLEVKRFLPRVQGELEEVLKQFDRIFADAPLGLQFPDEGNRVNWRIIEPEQGKNVFESNQNQLEYQRSLTRSQIGYFFRYAETVEKLVARHKASLLEEFFNITDSDRVNRITYTVKRLGAETHNCGAFPIEVIFNDPQQKFWQTTPGRVVIKPRSGFSEKRISDLNDKLNLRKPKSIDATLPTMKVIELEPNPPFSAHQYISGVDLPLGSLGLSIFQARYELSDLPHTRKLNFYKTPKDFEVLLTRGIRFDQVLSEARITDQHSGNIRVNVPELMSYGYDLEAGTNIQIHREPTMLFPFDQLEESERAQVKSIRKDLNADEKAEINDSNLRIMNVPQRAVVWETHKFGNRFYSRELASELAKEALNPEKPMIRRGWVFELDQDQLTRLIQSSLEIGDVTITEYIGNSLYIRAIVDGELLSVKIAQFKGDNNATS